MNVEHEDEEFVDVESRGSEYNKQNSDPPPELTGTKPSEFKSYHKVVHVHSSSDTRVTCFEQADRPSMGCL